MLTRDLLRLSVRGGTVRPSWLDPASERDLARAQRLLTLFDVHVGGRRGDLDDAIKAETSAGQDFKVLRGLAKLLMDRAQVAVASELDPSAVRALAFERAAQEHPLSPSARQRVIEALGAELGTSPEDVEAALYADLVANQRVVSLRPISAEGLIHRYNVALVQGVLLGALWMKIILSGAGPKRVRQLMRFLKFHRLMYRLESQGATTTFYVEGPVSIIKHSSRYGVAMANFFPALLLCEEWRLEVGYQKKRATRKAVLELDPSQGLRSHYRDTGTWVAPEETALIARLRELAHPWTVSEESVLLPLDGQDVLVPDIVLRDPGSGACAYIEVVWRWRKGSLSSRWELLRSAGPSNLILAVCSTQGAAGETLPELPGPVHRFKGVPNARALWKLCKQIAA